RVGLLVAIAVAVSAVLMAGLTAQAVMARTNCNDRPLVLNVAVSPDIAPAIQRVGQLFNKQSHVAGGRCVITQVRPEDPASVASVVDGQASRGGLPTSAAWIPDSRVWVVVDCGSTFHWSALAGCGRRSPGPARHCCDGGTRYRAGTCDQ